MKVNLSPTILWYLDRKKRFFGQGINTDHTQTNKSYISQGFSAVVVKYDN